ncbi:hypothetical protein OEZ85_000303 [Tetradesmus obliquus]|uniref:Leucine-rich repeat-containing N-terminal plant-type domain-containing protein n=1 Tax=Tetradesmus obliquus TaxID=3088 RepID=A0ABY8UQT3_TETOB|nr:hypothetical protein OEZ85_000303 [Tetradesmus obliquus]
MPWAPPGFVFTGDAQLDALLQLKAALDPTGVLDGVWERDSGRQYGFCRWRHVECDAPGRLVTAVNLTTDDYEVMLSGVLPPGSVLRGLTGLQKIDIRYHYLSGPLWDDWWSLPRLQVIRLDNNALTGTLPAAWSNFGSNLRVLTLWHNSLTGSLPPSWSALTSLNHLDLSFNALIGTLPAAWSSLGSSSSSSSGSSSSSSSAGGLQQLWLDVNQLTGTLPASWGGFGALEVLFLSENKLTGTLPEAWADMRQLRELWAEYNSLSGSLPEAYYKLGKLQKLVLNNNSLRVPKPWPAVLKPKPRFVPTGDPQLNALLLAKEALDETGALDREWNRKKGSRRGYCKWKYVVCDASQQYVQKLNLTTGLYYVMVLAGSLPSGAVLKGLPALREIDIRMHYIQGTIPTDWSLLTRLQVIRLDANHLHGSLPASIVALSRLSVLTLSDNALTGPLPPAWGGLRAMAHLDLSFNKFTGMLPPSRSGMSHIK